MANMDQVWVFHASVIIGLLTAVAGQDSGEIRVDFSIFEGYPAYTFVGNVATAAGLTSLNSSITANLRFSVLLQRGSYFSVDDLNGDIRTAEVIDRDSLCPQEITCQILIEVAALSSPNYFQKINVFIQINDTNDETPAFPQAVIDKDILENTPVGHSISIPVAEDMDSPQYGISSYRMQSTSEEFEFKSVKTSGDNFKIYLIVKKALDREVTPNYQLVIIASDGIHNGEVTININVLDVNDNPPAFSEDMLNVSIPEDTAIGQVIAQVSATDPDDGSNGQVRYSFNDETQRIWGETFGIDAVSGEISVQGELDYDDAKSSVCELLVEARDQGGQSFSAEITVIVNIEDVNDNSPHITVTPLTSSGKLELTESSPSGTYVAHISVTDPDSGPGGVVTCQLDPPSDIFRIESKQGYKLRLSGSLDRETQSHYSLVFSCADQGSPSLTVTQGIVIAVIDENDNYPVFDKVSYSVAVQENNIMGHPLVVVNATDEDSGQNGEISYSLHGLYRDFLSIDPYTGNVTAATIFDYEKYHNFSVEVRATDHGAEQFAASAVLHVIIVNKNDEPPRFLTESITFVVPENQEPPHEVGQLSAEDVDGGEFVFSLHSDRPNDLSAFMIDPLTGKISTRVKLDREERAGYEFVVKVTDTEISSLSSTSSVSVYVRDLNDNKPEIKFPTDSNNTIHISDKTPLNFIISQINAFDLDVGENGRLRYRITGGNADHLFDIDENSGAIILKGSLVGLDNEMFTLTISVEDRGDPPMVSESLFNIIVNKSIPAPGNVAKLSILDHDNATILISVAVVSTVIILILIIAIIMVKRQDADKRQRPPHYLGDRANLVASSKGDGSSNQKNLQVVKPKQLKARTDSIQTYDQIVGYSNEVDTKDELPPKMYDALGSRSPVIVSFTYNFHYFLNIMSHTPYFTNSQSIPI